MSSPALVLNLYDPLVVGPIAKFIWRCPEPRLVEHPTRAAARSQRLGRFDVTAVEADVLKPLPVQGPFDSAALHLVIHCLPGPYERKSRAVQNVAAVLADDGIFFGASVLGKSGRHTRAGRTLRLFNRQGGFDNLDDSDESLHRMFSASFEDVELGVIGSIAVFASGRRPT